MSSTNQPSQPEKMSLESMSIAEHQKAKLKELFPEVFTEGSKIDFERLKRTLGEMVDSGKERFGMNWAGKADCFKTIQQPSVATLVPCPEESIDFDTTENVFIEGDNLEVLKLLQKSYLGKIKMIYIDPPYNTGNDFVYPDDYSENLDTYLEYTGQIDGEGRKFSTNTDTDGRFHSKWMNMMYPRLFLAKNLLRDDGVIFISIDDNEVKNLIAICDEIFGEENFIAQLVVQTNPRGRSLDKFIAKTFEYVICYSKSQHDDSLYQVAKSEKALQEYDKLDSNGAYRLLELRNRNPVFNRENRPNLYFPIFFNQNKNCISLSSSSEADIEIYPLNSKEEEGCWTWSPKKVEQDKHLLVAKQASTGAWRVFRKDYLPEQGATTKEKSLWVESNLNHENGKEVVGSLFETSGNKIPFSFPKSVELVKRILNLSSADDDICLDFFAGSATTAHAVMDLNKQDGGNRKYICVQLPEPCDEKTEAFKAGFKTIAEISKERIRRAAAKIKADAEANTDLLTEEKPPLDLGFRVFKLQESNFKVWDATLEKDANKIQLALEAHIDHIDPNATQQAILFELLLKAGFELTMPIKTLILANKTVFSIAEGALLICLEKELTLDLIKAIADLEPSRVIVLDEGFQNNDQLKTNASLTLKAKGIVDFRTV